MSKTSPTAEPPSQREEIRLIRQIIKGRKELFCDLLEPHMIVLTRFVGTKLQHDAETDDVVQQTLLKAFTKLHQFRFEASFRTWLIRIAVNEVLRWRRDKSRSRTVFVGHLSQMGLPVADQDPSPFKQCQSNEIAGHLHKVIARLPAKYRAVVSLRDLQGFTVVETAEALNLNVQGVRTRHWRARREIAHFLRSSVTAWSKAC
ncbi:MAG: Sigma-70 region 2:Sigma-70 region 4 [Bryobacterales bacterium]|nr:Sigma-70 region 2:Sigma-70 region 4 [Bryobacterales bacterium]